MDDLNRSVKIGEDTKNSNIFTGDIKNSVVNIGVKDKEITRDKNNTELDGYFNYIKNKLDRPNPIDNRKVSEYYIRNRMMITQKDDWFLSDDAIDKTYNEENKWNIKKFLDNDNNKCFIGAPFGLGKTSFCTDLTLNLIRDFSNNKTDYIPIYVTLKSNFENVYNDWDLDYVIDYIIPKDTKILVIFDGVDEYTGDITNLRIQLKKYEKPNYKLLLVTRLDENMPKIFGFEEHVRILPFTPKQVTTFFSESKYNIHSIEYISLKNLGLNVEDIKTPLFCWLIAIDKKNSNLTDLNDQKGLAKIILYFSIIDSIIVGKYRKEINNPEYKQYEKWILRKIAALKNIYQDELFQNCVNENLVRFVDTEKLINLKSFLTKFTETLSPIIIAYVQFGKKYDTVNGRITQTRLYFFLRIAFGLNLTIHLARLHVLCLFSNCIHYAVTIVTYSASLPLLSIFTESSL